MASENLIPIPGRLHSVATEGHVAGADEIYDDTLQKDQATINAEVNEALGEGGTVDEKIAEAIDDALEDVAFIDDSESSPAVVPGFDPTTDTVHVTAQTLSESQKAQVRNNIGLGDVDAKINQAVASEASQRSSAVSGVQASVNAEASRAQAKENLLQNNIEALTQSNIVVVADHTSVSSPDPLTIYREQGTNTYSDWMYQNGSWNKMAEYDNAIDDEPTAGSNNLVKSGGIYEELDGSITISKPGTSGEWYAYKMKQGRRYRIVNTSSTSFSAWNATSQDLDARVDELCTGLVGGKVGPIITASADTNYIRIGSTSGAASLIIQDLESIKGNLTLINEGKESGVITLKSAGSEFLPFDFVAGHSYRVVNVSDSTSITVFVALDNSTVPPQGEKLCDNLVVGDISNAVLVQQNAKYVRVGATTGNAVLSIIDLDVYNGKFEAESFGKSVAIQNLLKSGYLFKGIATPSTVPVVGKYFYIATEPGDYSNFGRGNLPAGIFAIIRYYNNGWAIDTINNITTTIKTILSPYEVGSGIVMASDGSIVQIGSGGTYNGNIMYVKVQLRPSDKYTNIQFKAHASSLGGGYGFIVNEQWVGYPCPSSNKEITINVPSGATEFRTFWNRGVYSSNDIICNKPINTDDIVRISKESVPLSNGIIFEPEYDLSKIPAQDPVTRTTDVDALYELYDALLSQYPEYISKVNLSEAIYNDEGLEKPSYLEDDIYAYVFSPKLTGNLNGQVEDILKPIKAMVVTGTHPDEWFNVFTTYRMMKMICENWKTIPDCELVRTMVKLYIVPCLNPWGFRNSTRWNGHFGVNGNLNSGVNLNRNFPSSNWALDPTSFNNSGSVPGSEYETKVMMYYVDLVKPITFIDYHTPRMDENGNRGVWCGMSDKVYDQVGNSVLISTANWFRKEDSNYPQSPETLLYYLDNRVATGEEYQWVAERGYGLSVLLEGGETNRWVNGVLTDTEVEIDTPKLMRENIQYCFNALLKMLNVSIKMFM